MIKKLLLILLFLLLLSGCAGQEVPATETVRIPTEPPVEASTSGQTETVTQATTEAPAEAPTEAPTEAPVPEHFLLTFAGDCTLGSAETNLYALSGFVKTIGEDYGYPFRNTMEYFRNDDFSMVNLEGPLTDEPSPVTKKHVFRGPTAMVSILTQNSIQAVTLANNHSLDHGTRGYDSTVVTLTEAGVPFVEQDSTAIVTTPSGLTIGLYAVTYDHLDKEEICTAIAALRADENIDLVIFVPHWGVENTYRPNEIQKELGYAAIDAGADIVYGTHPHVLQPIEEYNGGVIYYSLGNFAFGGNGNPKDYDTAIIQQAVIRDPDGTVTLGQRTIIPCSVSSNAYQNNFQPTPYEPGSAGYDRVMQKLDGTFSG